MSELLVLNDERLSPDQQLTVLDEFDGIKIDSFAEKLDGLGMFPLRPTGIDIFQVNVGKMCNQTCKHCHVDAGPHRTEIMTRETMKDALKALRISGAKTVDITGGAPEMNPDFYWFVEQIRTLGVHVMVRSNLTILRTRKHEHAVRFFAEHGIEVVSSLPYYKESLTDVQRGDGVFKKSIEAIQALNSVGYGQPDSELILNLVYNPVGAYLPPEQSALETEYKRELESQFGIHFNSLFCITNMPISRYLEFLIESDNYEEYMELLIDSFNPSAAMGVMCRNTVSIGWDGQIYDCDFNQMLELPVAVPSSQHVKDWNTNLLARREIVLANHCFGCTAGSGSSCGGATA